MTTDDPFENTPFAVTSRHNMSFINESVVLYKGPATITETDGPTKRDVVIYHEWTPSPVIVCRYSTQGEQPFRGDFNMLHEPVTVQIPELGVKHSAYLYNRTSSGNGHRIGLAFKAPVTINKDAKMTRVVFHMFNCRDFSEAWIRFPRSETTGRIEFSTDKWAITIDQTEDHQKISELLIHSGGRAFTHRVQIARTDQSEFDSLELNDIVDLTQQFILFVTGSWACLTLPIGYLGDQESWQLWRAISGNSWAAPLTWSSHLPSKCIQRVFKSFARRFMDPEWNEPLRQTVNWYVQCRNGTDETSIILCQAALELLAWVIYVEKGHIILGSSGFENLWASDRIRLLLSQMYVSYPIPDSLTALREFKFDASNTYIDGPHAITEIRNGITHPKKQKRERFGMMGPRLRRQASELGLFYLESSILGLCGYFGPFRADGIGAGLVTREEPDEPVYQSADFSKLFGEQESTEQS